jgi:hypothetical protein
MPDTILFDEDKEPTQKKNQELRRGITDAVSGYGKSDLYQYTGRFLLILNGGAIVSIISFLGNFAGKDAQLSAMASGMRPAFLMYVFGAALAALVPSGISEYYMAQDRWQLRVNYYWTYFLVITPTVLFVLASYVVIDVMSTSLKVPA